MSWGVWGQEWGGSASEPVSPPPKSQSPSTSPIPIRAQPSERQHHLVSAGRGARGGAPNRAKKTLPTPPRGPKPTGMGVSLGLVGGLPAPQPHSRGAAFWDKLEENGLASYRGVQRGRGGGDIPHGARPGRSVCPQRPCVVALGRGAPPFFHLTPLWGFLRGEEDPCPGAWPLLPLPQHPADGAVYCSGPLAKQREERREGQKFPQTADSPGEPARSGTRCQRSCWLQAGLETQP